MSKPPTDWRAPFATSPASGDRFQVMTKKGEVSPVMRIRAGRHGEAWTWLERETIAWKPVREARP